MARVWRQGSAELIMGCLTLELFLFAYQLYGDSAAGSQLGKLIFWLAVDILLLWRIWRGGRVSWTILVILDAFALAELLLGLVWPWVCTRMACLPPWRLSSRS